MKPLLCIGLLVFVLPYMTTTAFAASPSLEESTDTEQSSSSDDLMMPRASLSANADVSLGDQPSASMDINSDAGLTSTASKQSSKVSAADTASAPSQVKAKLSIQVPESASPKAEAAKDTATSKAASASKATAAKDDKPKEAEPEASSSESASESTEDSSTSGFPFEITLNDGPSGRPARPSQPFDLSNIISISGDEDETPVAKAEDSSESNAAPTSLRGDAKVTLGASSKQTAAKAAAGMKASAASGPAAHKPVATPAKTSAKPAQASGAHASAARATASKPAAASAHVSAHPTAAASSKKVVPTLKEAGAPSTGVTHPVALEDGPAPTSAFKEETPMWSEPDQADLPLPSLPQPQIAGSLDLNGKKLKFDLNSILSGTSASISGSADPLAQPALPSLERAAPAPATGQGLLSANPLDGFPTIAGSTASANPQSASNSLLTPQQVLGNFGRDVMNITTKAFKLAGAVIGSPNTTTPATVPEIRSADDLRQLSDSQLQAIFQNGTAQIPGKDVGSAACTGEGLRNFATQDTLIYGPNAPLYSLWRGKIFYTDPANPSVTKVWNLLNNNNTVMATATAALAPGVDKNDRNESLLINYSDSEALIFRPLRDEIRKVGPNTYLGRAWVLNPVAGYKPTNPIPGTAGVVDSLEPALNATFMAGLRTSGFEGPNSLSKEQGGWGRYDAGEPFQALWFSMECQDDAVQRLHYSTVAQLLTALARDIGYQPANYTLPPLNDRPGDNAIVDTSTIQQLNEAAAPSVNTIRQLVRGQTDAASPTLAYQVADSSTTIVQRLRNGDIPSRVTGGVDNVVAGVIDTVRPAAGSVGNAVAGVINAARPAGIPAIPSNSIPGSVIPGANTNTAGR
eukprot:jgi/Botrbrau1/20466/Bobra.145_2s0028.1